jgi:hypothetical protein
MGGDFSIPDRVDETADMLPRLWGLATVIRYYLWNHVENNDLRDGLANASETDKSALVSEVGRIDRSYSPLPSFGQLR